LLHPLKIKIQLKLMVLKNFTGMITPLKFDLSRGY
jgi:hypothetical protein